MKLTFVFLLSLFLFACQTYSDEQIDSFDKKIRTYTKRNKLKTKVTDSGLHYLFFTKGEGRSVKLTDSVQVTYDLSLLNGDLIQKMHKPTYFCLRGLNNVIVGWKEGLIDKKVGDSILVIVPPQLGYGKYEVKDIQSNEILVYNIKVLGIK
ncbi:MAG: FKBP-type peptidyl-prolyl cis-trans isomerase [Flavobacteriia bacterium]|jgi:FKBP-type peptidyl-prolyl cis-trans isomerase FkpA|nr:hypothetical protein [Flavobacteriia bacterium]